MLPHPAAFAGSSTPAANAAMRARLVMEARPGDRTEFRRLRIGVDSQGVATATRMRADKANMTKVRLAWRIPYHEWEEALDLGHPYMRALLDAYAPRYLGEPPRCPPYKPRRYRGGAPVERWELGTVAPFRTSGGRRPRVWSI